jgi:hypothetical protein
MHYEKMYNYFIEKIREEEHMENTLKVTKEVAFDADVKTMSYEELMESIRFLDHEREMIAKRVHTRAEKMATQQEVSKRVA